MDENERVKLKYELLMSEIQECREDERNELNRVVQIIVAVGTIISVLFGTSLLAYTISPINSKKHQQWHLQILGIGINIV